MACLKPSISVNISNILNPHKKDKEIMWALIY